MGKVSARWVPKLPSAVQRQRRVQCARSSLDLNLKDVVQTIATRNENMALYYDPLPLGNPWNGGEWEKLWRFKVCQSTKKLMATTFFGL